MRNRKIAVGWATCIALSLWAVGMPQITQAAARKYLSLGTGNPGGTYYFIGAGFASLWNKYVPEVRVIAESTAASEENFNLLLRKKMDLGLVTFLTPATAGGKNMDLSGIRFMGGGHTSDQHWFVRKESPVKSLPDFRGRKVAVGSPGSGTLLSSRDELTLACGLTFEDFKPAYLSFSESVTAIKDGTVDVGLIAAGYPVASLLDLARQVPVRFIPYSEKEVQAIIAKHPHYVKIVIPGGTYAGVETDVHTRGDPSGLFCRAELSEDLVYKLMRAIYEHPAEKDGIHPQTKKWSLDNIFRGTDFITKYIPFHPGAVQYLKEKGVWKGGS